MKRRKSQSWKIAFCGVGAALAVALLLLGAVFPAAMFIFPALAGVIVMYACVECGRKMALTLYAAVGLLGILFVPDKEVVLIYLFVLGYYPLAKPRFDRLRRAPVRAGAKILYFNAAILAMYGLVLVLFPVSALSQELRGVGLALTATTLLIGNIAFVAYDKALVNLMRAYVRLWQPRLYRLVGRG